MTEEHKRVAHVLMEGAPPVFYDYTMYMSLLECPFCHKRFHYSDEAACRLDNMVTCVGCVRDFRVLRLKKEDTDEE